MSISTTRRSLGPFKSLSIALTRWVPVVAVCAIAGGFLCIRRRPLVRELEQFCRLLLLIVVTVAVGRLATPVRFELIPLLLLA